MISLLLPLAFTHQIAHYTDLILGTMISAIISDLIITIRSPHFGKLFFDNHFIKFWKLFLYSVLLLGLFAILFDLISPHIDTLMDSNLNYYFGISSCVLAFFSCGLCMLLILISKPKRNGFFHWFVLS